MGKRKKKLNNKQRAFARTYPQDRNATQAAIRAGYSKKTAGSQGHDLLKIPEIQRVIALEEAKIQKRNEITIDECVGILAKMARTDIADFYDEKGNLKNIHDIDADARLALAGLDTEERTGAVQVDKKGNITPVEATVKKIKISDRRANVIELLKYMGAYEKDNNQKKADNVTIFQLPDNNRKDPLLE